MTIKRAGTGNADTVGELIARFFTEEGFGEDPGAIRAMANPFLAEPTNAAFLAMVEGVAVGVATVTTTFGFEAGRYAELEDLYVLPEHRRSGVAARLVDSVAEWCRSRDCRVLEVVVTPEGESRHGLTRWYVDRGFADTARRILSRQL
jgi:GNAT superfamily N-acetyltransferase